MKKIETGPLHISIMNHATPVEDEMICNRPCKRHRTDDSTVTDLRPSVSALPVEILLHISTYNNKLFPQLVLWRPFYEYFQENREYVFSLHANICIFKSLGRTEYRVFNKPHRLDGPAMIWTDGIQHWCQYGKGHRDDGPAIVCPNGDQVWYQRGKLHREDGPAVVNGEYSNKPVLQGWYRHGCLHRTDGPAIIYRNGKMTWYINGWVQPNNYGRRSDEI